MREGFDKEIDSVLRRAARAPTLARGNGAGAQRPASHPDADELAAFAEGALPEPARLSAISHLADCDECRAQVVSLSRAAGVEAKLNVRAAVAASPSRERESGPKRGWLASLFAPRTLRYVAPALAVCLVAVVSFFALRTREGRDMLTQQQRPQSDAGARVGITSDAPGQDESLTPPVETPDANASANANAANTNAPHAPAGSAAATNTSGPLQKDDAPDGGPAVGGSAAAPVESKAGDEAASQPPPPAPKAKEEETAAREEPAPAKAAPPESAPAPKHVENMKGGPPPNEELAVNEQAQKRAAQNRNIENQAPDGSRSRQRSAADNAAGGGMYGMNRGESDSRTARSRRDTEPPAKRGRAAQEDAPADSERSAETRTVAGHRFRREGNAWVDVKYKSSMSSTGVRRGTDAYRALVADMPEIGRVAEQLGGEVIVVVGGRAYRIR